MLSPTLRWFQVINLLKLTTTQGYWNRCDSYMPYNSCCSSKYLREAIKRSKTFQYPQNRHWTSNTNTFRTIPYLENPETFQHLSKRNKTSNDLNLPAQIHSEPPNTCGPFPFIRKLPELSKPPGRTERAPNSQVPGSDSDSQNLVHENPSQPDDIPA